MTNTSPPNRVRAIDCFTVITGSIKKATVSGGFLLQGDQLNPF